MKTDSPNQTANGDVSRREFARTAIRTVLLGGLVTVGAVLARRACNARGTCHGCTLLAECALPWRKENS